VHAAIEIAALKIHLMRAFLVLLMLTLLPLQFSAAAAAACCGHVPATQGPQATHHQSSHGQAVEDVEGVVVGDSGFDLDCGTCHANCAAAVTVSTAFMPTSAVSEKFEHLVEHRLLPWHAQPYRPQWSAPTGSGWNAVA
jgi:cytochrome c5